MSVHRDEGRYVFGCNELGCPATKETREGRLSVAETIARRAGWTFRRSSWDGAPVHFCPRHR